MESVTELPVSLPGLRVVRGTTTTLQTGMKEHYGIGRIEQGDTLWWGSGRTWRSVRGSILVKQPGDVVRHLAHRGTTAYSAVTLPEQVVTAIEASRKLLVIPQLAPGDARAAPFHRLIDAACAGADRFTLEVALTEVLDALGPIGLAQPDYSRPVRRAVEYIRARSCSAITLDELACNAGLDKFHLCRAFRVQVGMPPHAYQTHLRVAHAKALLARGVRASDLAPLVGFHDQPQLTRHFKALVGTTPARYGKKPQDPKWRGIFRLSQRR
ncbi:MAG: AraC family transcriptional regulator [Polyangiales bacterium]